jgi:hypothetical protein
MQGTRPNSDAGRKVPDADMRHQTQLGYRSQCTQLKQVMQVQGIEFSGPVKSGFLTIFGATGLQPVVKKLKSLQLDFDRFKPVLDRLQPGALILNDSANISDQNKPKYIQNG